MKVALLIYEPPEAWAQRKGGEKHPYVAAWRAYYHALVEAGVYSGGDPLDMPEAGTTLRIKNGKRQVQDGPYADTKEQLGGMVVLEVASPEAAMEWAARCPAASTGAVEVRPLAPDTKRKITE